MPNSTDDDAEESKLLSDEREAFELVWYGGQTLRETMVGCETADAEKMAAHTT